MEFVVVQRFLICYSDALKRIFMDYPLENLDPERFQQLCQSLLTKEYPQVQCFPVGQPDGGRDAISFSFEGGGDKFMVFQVKYVRKPQSETAPQRWLTAIMEDEAPKVRELIPRGAIKYVLLTNVAGTAHLDSGSIDKLNDALADTLGIPSQCWWRDDINRRLDHSWDLKWVYPEVMSGPDFLRLIIDAGITEHRERRTATIKAFLRAQYMMDEEVRFKQVELQNKLLDLFIDVPIALRDPADERIQQVYFSVVASTAASPSDRDDMFKLDPDTIFIDPGLRWHTDTFNPSIGAATLILSRLMQKNMPHTVIEGAPGQGKSTIAQYVCQVHRMRLLNETDALSGLPKHHSNAPCRLPIRVDLRDFALWLGKRDPFSIEHVDLAPQNWNKSLESFLAALITNQSGGAQFSIDDLIAICRISSVLIVLDGLDEVADMTRRHEVVAEIVKGIQRLEENAASLQSIVTSRPAAFANSPGMPHAKYTHFQLLSLKRPLIMDYAERWLRARRVDARQSAEFRKVLREKLDQPHMRDLARNTMQLAILLSLVLTKGGSLPDKRTALYDDYIDLFLNRESEKSLIVRDHRLLLIDIHRYLAWLLHSQAENDNARPSVRQDVLQQLVSEYLSREGHDPDLSKELFTGMVERVVALVSRVEGTFEFEVQPLREYFAACHLYYTAPQSSPGKEKPGSKPDRFDAIAKNFYWLNVTRFFAGCYSKGELSGLVEGLQELLEKPGFHLISHPRILAATLLGDWVFTQNPRSVQQVVDLIVNRNGLRYALAPSENRRLRADTQNALVLPPKCGREELIKKCFELLPNVSGRDLAFQIVDLLKANSESSPSVARLWLEQIKRVEADARRTWLDFGVSLGVLAAMEVHALGELIHELEMSDDPFTLSILFRARRLDFLHASESRFEAVVDLILDRNVFPEPQTKMESPLDALSYALDPSRFAIAFRDRQPVPLVHSLERRNRAYKLIWSSQVSTETESFPSHRNCVDLARITESESQKSNLEWATDLAPWDAVIETARVMWGDRWAVVNLATVAAGIRSSTEKCSEYVDLYDHSVSLARRYRYARLHSGAHVWWKTQLSSVARAPDKLFALLPLLTWATNNTLLANVHLIDDMLESLSFFAWRRLFTSVRRCILWVGKDDESFEKLAVEKLPDQMGLRLAAILSDRLKPSDAHVVFARFMAGRPTEDLHILQFTLNAALDIERFGTLKWSPDLDKIRECYSLGVVSEPTRLRRAHRASGEPGTMQIAVADKILAEPDRFPGFLVTEAEDRRRQEVAKNITPVATIAEQEDWFGT
jgi:hypothetical protein